MIIAKKYLIPEVLKEHGLPANTIVFDDETVRRVIKGILFNWRKFFYHKKQ